MIQALLVTICLVVFPYQGSSIILESGNVNEYEVVYPQKVQALPKGGLQNAEPETQYEDTMQYEFQVNGEPVVLHLERNKGLFSEDYSETHYSPDGKEITTSPPVQDHCYYHGHIQNEADSTAVISACDGLKGHFKHQGETYFIEPLKLSDSDTHAVYKYDSLEKEDETPRTCGVTQTTWELDEPIEKISQLSITPEQQNTYLDAKKYIEFVVVVDNRMFRVYSSDLTVIRTRVYEIVNIVNTIYRALNIHVALIGLEIWSDHDKINVQSNASVTLDLFGAWRKTDLLPRKRNDNAQLLTVQLHDGRCWRWHVDQLRGCNQAANRSSPTVVVKPSGSTEVPMQRPTAVLPVDPWSLAQDVGSTFLPVTPQPPPHRSQPIPSPVQVENHQTVLLGNHRQPQQAPALFQAAKVPSVCGRLRMH